VYRIRQASHSNDGTSSEHKPLNAMMANEGPPKPQGF
jgi:hypothetical protein